MSDLTKIVEFPEAQAELLKKDAVEFRAKGKNDGAAPLWKFNRDSQQFDATTSMFVARQLEHIRAGVAEVQYTQLMYDRLLPINRSVSPGKTDYVLRFMDKVGEAVVVGDKTSDFPDVEASIAERFMKFFTIGLAYSYSHQEAVACREEGIPLSAKKAMICREQIERKINDIALLGSTASIAAGAPTVGGLLTLTDTGVGSYTVSTGSGGATSLDSAKSADDILADLHGLTSKPFTDSKGAFSVNTMLLPLTTRTYLASRRVGDGTNGSILNYFVGSDPFVRSEGDVVGMWELESSSAAGAGAAWTGKRAIAYRRDPAAIELMISQDFEQLAPQAVGQIVRTLCRARLAGISLMQPMTWIKADFT